MKQFLSELLLIPLSWGVAKDMPQAMNYIGSVKAVK